jgi:hypothetical protein
MGPEEYSINVNVEKSITARSLFLQDMTIMLFADFIVRSAPEGYKDWEFLVDDYLDDGEKRNLKLLERAAAELVGVITDPEFAQRVINSGIEGGPKVLAAVKKSIKKEMLAAIELILKG